MEPNLNYSLNITNDLKNIFILIVITIICIGIRAFFYPCRLQKTEKNANNTYDNQIYHRVATSQTDEFSSRNVTDHTIDVI